VKQLPRTLAGADLREIREDARRRAGTLSSLLLALGGSVAAVALVGAFVVLDYSMDQAPHRLVKILLGVSALVAIVMKPKVGLWLMPIFMLFLLWMPVLPVPGLNPQNVLLFIIFGSFALRQVQQRRPVMRRGPMSVVLLVMLAAIGISVVRGVAAPTGLMYNGPAAGVEVFRVLMTFSTYFITLAMVRGGRDRRAMVWAVMLGLLLESLFTISRGRTAHGRAEGSFGQANELGAYLAMFTAFTVAMIVALRAWWQKLVAAGIVVLGMIALLYSVSRGAMVAVAAAVALVAVRSSRMLTVVLLLAAVTSPLWVPDYVKDRVIGTTVEVEGTDDATLEASAQMRIDTWKAISAVVQDHFLDGVGFTGLLYVLPETGEALGMEVKDSAHNTYLRLLAEMGIAGLLLFLVLLGRCWWLGEMGMRAARDPMDRQLALGVVAATVAMAVSCLFGDRFFSIFITGNFWVLCALVSDLVLERRAEAA
jgi:O-antigen ligase